MNNKQETNAALRHDAKMRTSSGDADGLAWYSPWEKPMRLEGMGWSIPTTFRRMPLEPTRGKLTQAVDDLAWHTAGVQLHFQTDSKRICLRAKLRGVHGMDHMTATGQCGFDAYIGVVGQMLYAGTARFNRAKDEYQVTLCTFPNAERRIMTINFPLYQGVTKVEIGLEAGSSVSEVPPRSSQHPVVVYGTSITQGGCASRPGMAYPNILSRRIDAEFINLGFSGSGRGEPEVAEVISTLPAPAVMVLDYESNCSQLEKLQETLPVFLDILRKSWSDTQILVVSKVPYAQEAFNDKARKSRLANREFQRKTVARLQRAGDSRLSFLDGSTLLGQDYTECSVDGCHQTDLGFLRMANNLEKPLRKLLES